MINVIALNTVAATVRVLSEHPWIDGNQCR